MAKGPETKFKEAVFQDLKQVPHSKFVKIQQRSIRGTPDILGCVAGFFFAIELKKDKLSPADPLQKQELIEWCDAGGCAMICYPENWADSLTFILKFVEERLEKMGVFSSHMPKPTAELSKKKH